MINRRFVPFHFDLFTGGYLGDTDAKAFVKANLPKYSGNAVSTPPVVFITSDGQVLEQVSNYASTQQLLDAMLKILRDHPEYDRPLDAEQNTKDPMKRALICVDLQQIEQARSLLRQINTSESHLWLVKLARRENRWNQMNRWLAKITDSTFAPDIRVERAYKLWHDSEFDQLASHLKDFPTHHPRYTEAKYLTGLAHYHLGNHDAARSVWKDAIESCEQDPWIYKADWAYTESLQGNKKAFSTGDKTSSLLGRIGYMGVKNPDLQDRK